MRRLFRMIGWMIFISLWFWLDCLDIRDSRRLRKVKK